MTKNQKMSTSTTSTYYQVLIYIFNPYLRLDIHENNLDFSNHIASVETGSDLLRTVLKRKTCGITGVAI